MLKHIKIIRFENCYFRKETNPVNNEDNNTIEILSMNGCGILDNYFSTISFTALRKLDLSNNALVDPVFLETCDLPNLQYLDLSKNQIKMSKSRLQKFCNLLKMNFGYLEHLLLSENNFPQEFDYFTVACKKLFP